MPRKFTNEPLDPPTPFPSERNRGPADNTEIDVDASDLREPVSAPRGLMRKRLPLALWIVMALLLGGVIALVLFGVISG